MPTYEKASTYIAYARWFLTRPVMPMLCMNEAANRQAR